MEVTKTDAASKKRGIHLLEPSFPPLAHRPAKTIRSDSRLRNCCSASRFFQHLQYKLLLLGVSAGLVSLGPGPLTITTSILVVIVSGPALDYLTPCSRPKTGAVVGGDPENEDPLVEAEAPEFRCSRGQQRSCSAYTTLCKCSVGNSGLESG